MKQQTYEKQRINKSCSLLSLDENELVFSLLGRRCQTMCTSVIQLYTTEPPAHSSWVKRANGIACFVRDSNKRSYFIRIYCPMKHEMLWEEEMYDSIDLTKSREFLICFEGLQCMVAMSFASDAEANLFYKIATTTVNNRMRKRHERKSRKSETHDDDSSFRNQSNANAQKSPFAQAPQASTFAGTGLASGRDRKRVNRKLTKADISTPSNFIHIAHVGWNPQKGFDTNDEHLNDFLTKAGVSPEQLKDPETREYIYDFIESNNVMDSVKSENEQQTHEHKQQAPPVPTRNNAMQRSAPPPPPPPNVTRAVPAQPPVRPPPIQKTKSVEKSVSSIPAPPPPPPPMPILPPPSIEIQKPATTPAQPSIPAETNDSRSALLDQIRKGKALRKVDPATLSTGSGSDDGRSNLLKEIRLGVELRPAGEHHRESVNRGTDALADALRRALQERSKAIQSSDEEESSDNDEWDD